MEMWELLKNGSWCAGLSFDEKVGLFSGEMSTFVSASRGLFPPTYSEILDLEC